MGLLLQTVLAKLTGRDMFGNKISKEQQHNSINAALAVFMPFGAKGFSGKTGLKASSSTETVTQVTVSRKGAFKEAKRDAGIPRAQQPESIV